VSMQRFEQADTVRELPLARFELVRLDGMTLGRATCRPGWRWSEHVGSAFGATRCVEELAGLVLSGEAKVAMDDGTTHELTPGTLFHIPARAHDSWVVGDVPFVALQLVGADRFSRAAGR